MIDYQISYWYARGYYDGRSEGKMGEQPSDEKQLYAYKAGYEVGVADYSRIDYWQLNTPLDRFVLP